MSFFLSEFFLTLSAVSFFIACTLFNYNFQINHLRPSPLLCHLIDVACLKISHAVFYDKGYFLAGHVDTIAVRFRTIENRAYFSPVVNII